MSRLTMVTRDGGLQAVTLEEGKVKKGGVNEKPPAGTAPARPPEPQGGRGSCGVRLPHADERGLPQGLVVSVTLRDWFAAQATEADIEAHTEYRFEGAHRRAVTTREQARYRYADAMISAGEARS